MNGVGKKIKVIIISSQFPNIKEPQRGLYTLQIIQQMKRLCELQVISPLPWVPNIVFFRKLKKCDNFICVPKFKNHGGINVFYPRYFMIPKIWGPFLSVSVFFAIFGLLKKLKNKNKVDAINVHWLYPEGVSAALAASILKIPIVLSALGSDVNLFKKFLLRRIQIKWALSVAESITSVTDALKEEIVKLGLPASKIETVPNGIDRKKFFIRPKDKARNALGLKNDFKLILFVGSFDRFVGRRCTIKGAEHLIEAIYIMKKNYPGNFRLALIGEGPLREKIKKAAIKLGLSDTALFFGTRPHEEIALWMNACDVLVRPTLIEGMPNVVMEALACGKPVVGSNIGGLVKIINSKNGILVEPANSNSIANGLKEALMKRWDEREIVRSIEKYTWENTAQGYFQQITKAIQKNDRRKLCL